MRVAARELGLYDTRNVAGADEVFAPDLIDHNAAADAASGIDGMRASIVAVRDGFTDTQHRILFQQGLPGSWVVLHWWMTGMHRTSSRIHGCLVERAGSELVGHEEPAAREERAVGGGYRVHGVVGELLGLLGGGRRLRGQASVRAQVEVCVHGPRQGLFRLLAPLVDAHDEQQHLARVRLHSLAVADRAPEPVELHVRQAPAHGHEIGVRAEKSKLTSPTTCRQVRLSSVPWLKMSYQPPTWKVGRSTSSGRPAIRQDAAHLGSRRERS
ncbi:hypothetical protein SSP24_76810 [Streptomyces spinoverrucosus]|uniref:SnoaL-like domain-containing protein n=1 Tax=Streptomyces spinoverrucosus TaxID=284043 RepID=A0A4Y3VYA8_9ACTN|nr:hypothetical protein SSP24_76810 [Streptomyces spinoverrucosus]GHB75054.1 hypothetical protein GCM10010397_51750 [Streptomyces spinoverrucosus]